MIDLFGFDYDQGGLAGPGAASRLRATGNELARSSARGVAGALQQGSTNPAAASMAVNEVQRGARSQALQQALQADAAYRQQQAGMARQTIMSGIGAAASLGAMAIPGAQAAKPAVDAAKSALGTALGDPAGNAVPAATPPPNPYGAPQNPVADATRQALTSGAADVGQQAQAMVSPAAGAGPAAAPAPQAPQAPAPAPAAPGVPPPIDVGATTQQIQTATAPALNRAFDWARSSNPYDQPAPTQAQGQAPVRPLRPMPPPASPSVVTAGSTPDTTTGPGSTPRLGHTASAPPATPAPARDLAPGLIARPGENWRVGGEPAAPGIPRGMDAPPPGGIGNAPGSTRSLIAPAPTLAPPGPPLGSGGTRLRPEYTVVGGGPPPVSTAPEQATGVMGGPGATMIPLHAGNLSGSIGNAPVPFPSREERFLNWATSPARMRQHPDALDNRANAGRVEYYGDPNPETGAVMPAVDLPNPEAGPVLSAGEVENLGLQRRGREQTMAAQSRERLARTTGARASSALNLANRLTLERQSPTRGAALPREDMPPSALDLEPSPTSSALSRAARRGPAPADTPSGRVAEGAERALSRLLGRLTDLGIDPRSLF